MNGKIREKSLLVVTNFVEVVLPFTVFHFASTGCVLCNAILGGCLAHHLLKQENKCIFYVSKLFQAAGCSCILLVPNSVYVTLH